MGNHNIKKIYVFGAVSILIVIGLMNPVFGQNYENIKRNSNNIENILDENTNFKLKIRYLSDNQSNDGDVLLNLTQEKYEELKNEINKIKKNDKLTDREIFEQTFEIIKKYTSILDEISIENITNIYNSNVNNSNYKPLDASSSDYPYIRFGPTVFIYLSVFSQYSFIGDPTSDEDTSLFNIIRLNEILEKIFTPDNQIYKLLNDLFQFDDVSVGQYGRFAFWQIGIGGSIGFFSSFSPVPTQNYHFFGPFLGIFLSTFFYGLYIYFEIENSEYPGGSFELPLLDFIIGVPLPFSIVVPGWYFLPSQ